jgi:YiiM-like, 3-alpha helix domain
VTRFTRPHPRARDDVEVRQRAAELDGLPESWRDYFRKRLSAPAA